MSPKYGKSTDRDQNVFSSKGDQVTSAYQILVAENLSVPEVVRTHQNAYFQAIPPLRFKKMVGCHEFDHK